jgi:hypothetical protein
VPFGMETVDSSRPWNVQLYELEASSTGVVSSYLSA